MADSPQDRHLPASQRKISKAREDGQVARSRDLSHFTAIAVGGALMVTLAPEAAGWLRRLMASGLQFDVHTLAQTQSMGERLSELALKMMLLVLPFGIIVTAAGVAASVACGGWNWTFKAITPKFSKLNPLTGLGRMFGKDQLVNTLKASFLALVLGTIGALYLRAQLPDFVAALALPLPSALSQAVSTLQGGLALLVLALALFAAVDVPLQRKMHLDRLKMSHQEVKEEFKQLEGNVEIKSKMKARMRELGQRRMLASVAGADLVVMNPTHYAVALKYDDAKMAAPRVVAKGADLLAFQIRDLAKEHRVPVLQAPPLARALYAHAEIDREVPAALFAAVAQVLAYVYQLRAAIAGRGAMPADLPPLPVPAELDPQSSPLVPPGDDV